MPCPSRRNFKLGGFTDFVESQTHDIYVNLDHGIKGPSGKYRRDLVFENRTAGALVPELVGSQFAQLVELDLLREDIERDVDRTA